MDWLDYFLPNVISWRDSGIYQGCKIESIQSIIKDNFRTSRSSIKLVLSAVNEH